MGTGDIIDFDNIQVSYTEIPANNHLDRFNTNGANNGSNGTQSWTNNWTEILELTGFNAGNTIVTGNQLKIALTLQTRKQVLCVQQILRALVRHTCL